MIAAPAPGRPGSRWLLFVLLFLSGCAPEGTRPEVGQEGSGPAIGAANPTSEASDAGRSAEIGTAIAYRGGSWWNGDRFEARTVYTVGDTFTFRTPARIDREVDLQGGWVVPPFGDAHAHHFETVGLAGAMSDRLLAEGVFYGMSLNNWTDRKPEVLPLYSRPGTLDVAFADLGLTASYGHPVMVYENLARERFDFDPTEVSLFEERQGEGTAYLLFDRTEDVDRQWEAVTASRPDLLKIYLLRSERWEAIAADSTWLGGGLAPDVAEALVRRAHAEGLRVAAHVETAHDFRLAVEIGVDVIAHLPGYGERHDPALLAHIPALHRVRVEDARLDAEDARAAAARGVVVIPTPISPEDPGTLRPEARAFLTQQLRTLRDAGVSLAIGSDRFGGTPLRDVRFLHDLGIFSNGELLEVWGRATATTIFPERRIGRLAPGHEASFLVLACDPVESFDCVERIQLRVKEGHRIEPPPT